MTFDSLLEVDHQKFVSSVNHYSGSRSRDITASSVKTWLRTSYRY